MSVRDFIATVENRLIVSCQALPQTPLDKPEIIKAIAQSVELAGAAAVRIDGGANIRAIRKESAIPVIGIYKTADRSSIYITPLYEQAVELKEAGASIIALQATNPRQGNCTDLGTMIDRIHSELGLGVMADISTLDEAIAARELGADIVATTLSGYTPHSRQLKGPDLELVKEIADKGIPVIAEGRYHTPQQVVEALNYGAISVVVGTVITMPDRITRYFIDHIQGAI